MDRYFLEHRGKVLDIAAFLDRVDRARSASPDADEDFRIDALKRALALLLDGNGGRAKRVLELWSDDTTQPIQAAGTKGATGTVPPPP